MERLLQGPDSRLAMLSSDSEWRRTLCDGGKHPCQVGWTTTEAFSVSKKSRM